MLFILFLFILSILSRATPALAERLPATVTPAHYDLAFTVDLARARFEGTETIRVQVNEPTPRVVLNAIDLAFRDVTIAAGGGRAQRATVSLDEQGQTATLTVPQPLAKGPAEIRIQYSGILNDKLRGFYLSKSKEGRYAVTQFESTDARRAFPCFDEPAFKATFAVTLVVDRGDTAISNGTVVSDTNGPQRSQHTVKFATSPKMSSYLVAMAVGRFECLEGSAEGVPIRICATPDKKALVHLALESVQQILTFYNSYFAIKYPFRKLDVVAVPDFAAGAMENTAAIFYRETDLLADAKTASMSVRKGIASILAHEIAHQWFGDLVTMKWWDDIWLNEGFATWMANHPLAAWKPEWNVPVDEALENQTALNLDSLKSTRPIRDRIDTPAEIEEAFDAIAYEKGAAVLRMIEGYLGAEAFEKGVNAYLQAHAYGNATSQDFWTSVAETSGKPVDRIMPTFVDQPGSPLVDVSFACTGGTTQVTLAQERFFLDSTLLKAGSAERWQVPVCLKTSGQQNATCDVLSRPSQTIAVGTAGCVPWVFANAGAKGYYRTAYAPEALKAMAPHVEDALSAPERLSLLGDEWALVRSGRHTVSEYLTLASGFGSERTSGVLGLVTDGFRFIHEYLTADATRARFEAFTRSLLRPSYDEVGFVSASGDTDDRRALRAALIDALGTTGGDPEVVATSRAALDRALGGGRPLDPAVAGAIVRVAAEHGNAKLYDELMAASDRVAPPEEHYRYLYALADFRDPALIDRALQYSFSPQLRSQDTAIYLGRFFGNEAARLRAWSFLKQHWAELESKIVISFGDVNLVNSLSSFCDAGTRDDIKTFFAEHRLPTAARTLDQTIDRINNCMELRDKQATPLTEWLATR
jgi:aminopeptidase N